MKRFPASLYAASDVAPETVKLEIRPTALVVYFASGASEVWPLAACFAGQPAQGEAMCIFRENRPDRRIYARNDIIRAVQAARAGDPMKLSPWRFLPWEPILLFGFLALCALVWAFA